MKKVKVRSVKPPFSKASKSPGALEAENVCSPLVSTFDRVADRSAVGQTAGDHLGIADMVVRHEYIAIAKSMPKVLVGA